LKDLAAKLRVAISAHIDSRISVNAQSVDRYTRSQLSEDVARTEFKNYALEKSAVVGQNTYALVRVERKAFIFDLNQKLVAAEKEIAIHLANIEKKPAIEKFVAQQKALPWIEKAFSASQILSGADENFDGKRVRAYEALLVKAKGAASELTFDLKVRSDNRDIAETLRTFLNESGLIIGGGGSPLVIDAIPQQDIIFGSKTVQLKINLRILDTQGRSLASKDYAAHGSSMTDHRAARQAALGDFAQKLREASLINSLGFNSY